MMPDSLPADIELCPPGIGRSRADGRSIERCKSGTTTGQDSRLDSPAAIKETKMEEMR